jgi:hypothetical protein
MLFRWTTVARPPRPTIATLEWPKHDLLLVKLETPRLTAAGFGELVMESVAGHADKPPRVLFDFSAVDELLRPWTIHFAILIHLARMMRRRVRVCGLHGQPLEVARLYWHHDEVRDLCEESV